MKAKTMTVKAVLLILLIGVAPPSEAVSSTTTFPSSEKPDGHSIVPSTSNDFTIVLGESRVFTAFNVHRTETEVVPYHPGQGQPTILNATSDGNRASTRVLAETYQEGLADSWVGVSFSVVESPSGTQAMEAEISMTLDFSLNVDFNVPPPSDKGGGSADARVDGNMAGSLEEVNRINFQHYSNSGQAGRQVTLTRTLSLNAGEAHEVAAHVYSYGDVYIGGYANSHAEVTVEEISVTFGCVAIEPTTSVTGGSEFYEPETGEEQIPAPVFTRGGRPPTFLAEIPAPGAADSVDVEITNPTGQAVRSVSLTQSANRWQGSWDWTGASWTMVPDDIPVGEYTAQFQIRKTGCSSVIQDEPFYVVFDSAEVIAPHRFALDGIGIWFTSGWGEDRAQIYALHPDDNRVFSRAIEQIEGETNQYNATVKLLSFENGMFSFDDHFHANDVIHLIEEETAAQCVDDANMLTALLRSVGIPARPLTADFAVEHRGGHWSFDTWVEARLKGPYGEQWYALHPHQGTGLGPEPRNMAGTWWVASKSTDDVLITATGAWSATEVADLRQDLEFGYNECDEPNQNFNYKAAWIDHLCLDYWGEGHWTCPDASLQTLDEGMAYIAISLDRERYSIGNTVLATVTISNPTNAPISSNLVVSVTADDPLSMQFPDQILQTFEESVTVEPSSSKTITKSYELPLGLFSEHRYYVEASYADLWTMTTFVLDPLFEWSVTLPGRVKEGAEFAAQLTITNPQVIALENISVTLGLPFDIGTQDPREQRISALEQGTAGTLTWNLTALSRSEVSQLVFTIASDNAGHASIFRGVEIYASTRIYLPLLLRND